MAIRRSAAIETVRMRHSYRLHRGYGAAMPEWDAEVEVDGTLVRALLAEQFPELDADSARRHGEGWDNSV